MNIVRHVFDAFLQALESVTDILDGKVGFTEFAVRLHAVTDRLACDLCQLALEEEDRKIREDVKGRKGWVIERRNDEHMIMMPFGEVRYRRTYYREKQSGAYAYLSDKAVGIALHERIHATLKAELVANASEVSYRKSGQYHPNVEVSGQAVLQHVHKVKTAVFQQEKAEKRVVSILHIGADEDHVSSQRGPDLEAKLVYVHEGWQELEKGRYTLKNAHYFSGIYHDPEELWEKVWEYLDSHYDMDKVEKIFVSGDGARWIRMGVQFLPNAVFVLDRFHIAKYLTAASLGEKDLLSEMKQAVKNCDRKALRKAFERAESQAKVPSQLKAIDRCRKYLRNNWCGIEAYRQYPEVIRGCSAEGHVSHILSARLSRRPAGWSEHGVDQMARLRALRYNGVSIREFILAQHPAEQNPLALRDEVIRVVRKELISRYSTINPDTLNNMPVLGGKRSPLRDALNMLRQLA